MKMMSKKKIVDLDTLKKWVNLWKTDNQKVVFTNGCFDLLHLGHVDYLEKAAALGDKFIVAVNTDKSVQKNKGITRPITNQESRARLLAAFGFVDAVILFEEETPLQLISVILPTTLVKGEDYSLENIVGADLVLQNGGEVKTIAFLEGYSTSKIIAKIKNE